MKKIIAFAAVVSFAAGVFADDSVDAAEDAALTETEEMSDPVEPDDPAADDDIASDVEADGDSLLAEEISADLGDVVAWADAPGEDGAADEPAADDSGAYAAEEASPSPADAAPPIRLRTPFRLCVSRSGGP